MVREHTDREFEAELHELRDQVLLMGANVEAMIARSMRAVTERDNELARQTIAFDHRVNRQEVLIDSLAHRILARRQPVASDLRMVTTTLKLVTDLERMADLAVNVCERAIELNGEPLLKPLIDLPAMAVLVQQMLRDALDALVVGDSGRAQQVIETDRHVDSFYGQIFRELLTYMMADPRAIPRAMRLQSIAKYLERIGDHVTNLAELVIFKTQGRDVRHLGHVEAEGRAAAPHGVLFICRHNQARSQMAEGWARKVLPTSVHVWSAGIAPTGSIHPDAVLVMREVGLDISAQRPKALGDVPMGDIDTIVVLGEDTEPLSLAAARSTEVWQLADPTTIVDATERLDAFRRTRDEVSRRIAALARTDDSTRD